MWQMDVTALNMNTPSPFKKRDLITRTPQAGYHRDWTTSNGISAANPVPMGVVNGEYMYKRPDALTPENSSEEDREEHIEDTPIYLQSERWRNSASQSYHDRYTPEEDYDADSIIGAYNPNQQNNLTPTNVRSSKRYSSISDDVLHSSRFSQTTGTDGDAQTILFHPGSLSRRDITPSKIPIFQASPKPIPMEYIFRSSRLHRSTSANLLETTSDDIYPLKRVKSESLLDNFQSSNQITTPSSSPTKNKRKYPTLPRPRSRSLGSVKQITPSSSRTKYTPTQNKRQHETFGEPPWLHHTFSPDPSLPADQQLIPTVAKRIEQERLEREKGLVTVWDREMRPLEGDRRIRESRVRTHKESDEMPTGNLVVEESIKEEEKTWPLGIDVQKTKSVVGFFQGSVLIIVSFWSSADKSGGSCPCGCSDVEYYFRTYA